MIVLATAVEQFRLKVGTDPGEDLSQVAGGQLRERVATGFCDKDQMVYSR